MMPCIQVGTPANFEGSPKELAFAVRRAIFDKAGELGERDKIPDLYENFLVQVGFDRELPNNVFSAQMAFNPRTEEAADEYLKTAREAISHHVPRVSDIYWAFLNVEPEGWTGDWSESGIPARENVNLRDFLSGLRLFDQLYPIAQMIYYSRAEVRLKGFSRMKKAQLVDAICQNLDNPRVRLEVLRAVLNYAPLV